MQHTAVQAVRARVSLAFPVVLALEFDWKIVVR